MDAFTQRVELEDDSAAAGGGGVPASVVLPLMSDREAADELVEAEVSSHVTLEDDDQVVPGQEQHQFLADAVATRRRPAFYEG